MSTNHVPSRLALLAASAIVFWRGAARSEGAYLAPQAASLGALRAASATPGTIEYQGGFPVSVRMDVATSGTSPAERARTFLTAYADLYLQNDPDVKLIHVRTDRDAAAGDLVRFAQSFHDLPVFGAEIVVHLGPAAAGTPGRVLRTSGALLVPARTDRIPAMKIDLDRVPGVTPQMAADAARSPLGRGGAPLRGETILVIYAPAMFGATVPDDARHLAWRVTLGGEQLRAFTSANGFPQPAFDSPGFDDDIRLVFCYPGHIWGSAEEQARTLAPIDALLQETIDLWKRHGLKAGIVSGGSTPTGYQSHHLRSLTEIRPGTYIYNDRNCLAGNWCTLEDCAARIVCTVVSDAVPGKCVLDAGTKTFTSDRLILEPMSSGHGLIVEYPRAKIVRLAMETFHVSRRMAQLYVKRIEGRSDSLDLVLRILNRMLRQQGVLGASSSARVAPNCASAIAPLS